jgi:hypothetical protein
MTDTERAAALLQPAMLHLRTVQIAIDQLTLLDAKAELHTLTVRLMELAFRAEPDSRTVKKRSGWPRKPGESTPDSGKQPCENISIRQR